METIREVLRSRDGLGENEISELLKSCAEEILDGISFEEAVEEWFGLEPDYCTDLELLNLL